MPLCQALSDTVIAELGHKNRCLFGDCFPIPLLGVKDFLKDFILTIDYPNKKFSLVE